MPAESHAHANKKGALTRPSLPALTALHSVLPERNVFKLSDTLALGYRELECAGFNIGITQRQSGIGLDVDVLQQKTF